MADVPLRASHLTGPHRPTPTRKRHDHRNTAGPARIAL